MSDRFTTEIGPDETLESHFVYSPKRESKPDKPEEDIDLPDDKEPEPEE